MSADPRQDPTVTFWLSSLEPRECYVMTLAISYAIPYLGRNCDWQQRIEWARRQLDPSTDEDAELVAAAGRIAGRISAEMKRAA